MSSFTHKILKSQLLDLVIGIESIFSENAESISYKYSLRGSLAIGKTKEERLIVRNELKLAYAIRSNLAHGSNDSLQKEAKTIVNDDAKLYSFVTNLRQTLSKAIINKATWIKNNGKSGKEFLNFLDEAMVAKGLDETFYQS